MVASNDVGYILTTFWLSAVLEFTAIPYYTGHFAREGTWLFLLQLKALCRPCIRRVAYVKQSAFTNNSSNITTTAY